MAKFTATEDISRVELHATPGIFTKRAKKHLSVMC